jgi:ActR/RegA family two-component response regulator
MSARSEEAGRRRPHVIIAHSDAGYTMGVVRAFRRNGWRFTLAANGPEARRLASTLAPNLVVLEAELPGESGWLTCAKLNVGESRQSVILVTEAANICGEEFAEFIGALRLVTRADGPEALLEESGLAVPA